MMDRLLASPRIGSNRAAEAVVSQHLAWLILVLEVRIIPARLRTSVLSWCCLGMPLYLVCLFLCPALQADEARLSFRRDVAPILSDKCYKCHGPDENARQADLRLDIASDAEYVLSPEAPDESELLRRVFSNDEDEIMPPRGSRLMLSQAEREVLRRWINEGGHYESHWAFVPARRPEVPTVNDALWPRSAIDHFVLAALEAADLTPARPADRARLIRRLTFDLTGLPPTLEEVDAFLSDDIPGAFERVVDRLLASEQYGVRMAADWLDLARYSDTYGYQVDRDRYVWPWRDWVVGSFNENMPYDQFVTWQLAGDLLPQATNDQILATTFNRLHPQKVEGGSVPEEFRVEYVADRNHTFGTALLGLTLECARCHDHKFDPVSQKEYYELFAFFNNIDEAGLYSYFTNSVPTPTLRLASPAANAEVDSIEREIKAAEESLAQSAEGSGERFESWLAGRTATGETLIQGEIAHLGFEDLPSETRGALPRNRGVAGKVGKAALLTGDDGIQLDVGNFPRYQPFSVGFWMNTPDVKDRAVIFHRSRAWTDAASRGYQLLLEDGCLSASLIHFWPGNAIRVRTTEPLPTGSWHHVVVTYDGSSRADGLRIFVDGRSAPCQSVRDRLTKNITGGGNDEIIIGERFRDRGFTGGRVDEFRVFDRQLTGIEVAHLADGRSIDLSLADAARGGTAKRAALREYYLHVLDDEYREQLKHLQAIRKRRSEIVDDLDEIMVMRELENSRTTHLLSRGAYDAPGEVVHPNTPSALPSLDRNHRRDRLGLAQWLTSPEHPLTARVAVNRIWKTCFGVGLVRTPEDFGSQGQPPTHPELLDWLTREFIEQRWDTKQLIKKIVMSATYRQDSRTSALKLSRDPENRLLSRGTRYRLPAEMIRDNALAVSGLLVPKLGGPPAKPYEVGMSFKPVEADKGAGLYRRSLYTYWKRTAPAPVMMTLDAAKRDVCVARRERTTSPLQAFVLMNDPQLIEASIELGRRSLERCDGDVDRTLEDIFRRLTSRIPRASELEVLRRLFAEQRSHFEGNSEEAAKLLAAGGPVGDNAWPAPQRAAAALVASTLMNLDSCVVKR